jgi:hypothetical protein
VRQHGGGWDRGRAGGRQGRGQGAGPGREVCIGRRFCRKTRLSCVPIVNFTHGIPKSKLGNALESAFLGSHAMAPRLPLRLWLLPLLSALCLLPVLHASALIHQSIQQNLFGTCKHQETTLFPSFSNQSSLFYVHQPPIDPDELITYESMPHTLTQVNEKLAQGIVKGKPSAEIWANRKDNSWQYPEQHPRRNKTNCLILNNQAAQNPITAYNWMRNKSEGFYLLMHRNVLIHETGIVGSECGYFQCLEGCETVFKFIGRKWHQKCTSQLNKHSISWEAASSAQSPLLPSTIALVIPSSSSNMSDLCRDKQSESWSYASEVFVVSSIWDSNYHHFLIDVLPRLIRYLPYLRKHPEIYLHIRRSERQSKASVKQRAQQMKQRLLALLGLDERRLISGPVVARSVFLPRSMMCNFPILNALEVR